MDPRIVNALLANGELVEMSDEDRRLIVNPLRDAEADGDAPAARRRAAAPQEQVPA